MGGILKWVVINEKRSGEMTTTLKVKGMSCNHCVMAVTMALNEVEGLSNVNVNLQEGSASFDSKEPVNMQEIVKKIEKAGFEVG
jgi:copper chaperone